MRLRTLLDIDLPPLNEVEQQLADMRSDVHARLAAGAVLAVVAAAALFYSRDAMLVVGAGAAAGIVSAAWAFDRRRSLLGRLVRVRDAYRLAPVSEAGGSFANAARRKRLAVWLRRLVVVAEGDGVQMAYTAAALEERVLARRERLLALAEALEAPDGGGVHPSGVAIVHCLLTRPPSSPLYNPAIDEDLLDLALHRVDRRSLAA
jgi:hypothetical protein